jgi:hypothetical protein
MVQIKVKKKEDASFSEQGHSSWINTEVKSIKREKNDKIRTGVSGVSGGSLCNRLACPLLA